jgi:two-component system nitrogen regulation sensor histidine kinase GlnL
MYSALQERMPKFPFLTLEHLATAVILLDDESRITYLNPAAEHLFDVSGKNLLGHPVQQAFTDAAQLTNAMQHAIRDNASYIEHDLTLGTHTHGKLHLRCAVTPVPLDGRYLLLEFHPMDRPLKLAREEQMLDQTQANRLLLRNLAHEIKNPLGGIRGAAQLLEYELPNPALKEYTQVIIKEADRLQDLMQRLLRPHRPMLPATVNIHEILERVRSLLKAEFPGSLQIVRDYDTGLPELIGDREQLIQAVLNIARNAAQAMNGEGEIVLRTRILRQVTLAKKRYKLAMELKVLDNGPGIPDDIRERMFYPLVSGREGGSGLGLTIAQNFVQHHHGTIDCSSRPGHTVFTLRLPIGLA